MIKISQKAKSKYLILLFGIIMLMGNAAALAVTSVCSDLTPCFMAPSEEKIYDFLLQSSPGDGNILVRFEIIDDAGGIAGIVGGNEFNVASGESVNAKLKVKIPENSNEGNMVNVVLRFTQVPNNEGQVSLSPSFTMHFPLTVKTGEAVSQNANPKGANPFFWILIAVVLVFFVLIAITSIVIKNKKKNIA
mgnify:CR=1 FL=1